VLSIFKIGSHKPFSWDCFCTMILLISAS
jgi:hypothetical protein